MLSIMTSAAIAWSTGAFADALPPVTVVSDPPSEPSVRAGDRVTAPGDRKGPRRHGLEAGALERLNADRLEELAGAVPGAHAGREEGGLGTAWTLRGFEVTTPQWNGLTDIDRLFVRDPYTVEQVEVVPGPDAILQGVTSPGGSIRYQGKRPEYTPAHEVGVEAGYPDHRRVVADTTGPVGDHLAYRLTLAGQDGESRPAEQQTERLHALAGLAWRYHADGELRLEHGFQRNRQPYDMGTVWLEDGPVYDTPLHSPDQESDRRYQRTALYWDHALTEGLAVSLRAAHSEVEREEAIVGFYSFGLLPAPEPVAGYAARIDDQYTQDDLRLQLEYEHDTARTRWHWVVGGDMHRQEIDFRRDQLRYWDDDDDWWQQFSVDPRDPDFAGIELSNLALTRQERPEETDRYGAYLANRLEVGARWAFTAGVRHTEYEVRKANEDDPELAIAAEDRALTWQAGLQLDVTRRAQLFAHAGTGIRPNEGIDRHGDFLPSRESAVTELGWRYAPDRRQQLVVAAYHLREENLPQEDEAYSEEDYFRAVGEVEVEGVEARYVLDTGAWRIAPNATLQRSRNYDEDEPAERGNHFEGVPRHLAGLEVDHDLGAYTPLALRLWYCAEYVGGWYLDDANDYRTDGYTLHSLGAIYQWPEGTRLDLRVRNATDERYLAAPRVQGERREVRLGLSRRF
ncbi:TonB-dependent receptor [Halorhodospira halophila SL1]|uniref:TonB-dependent receptor n=2 Tax=Pseudomonadota TaxID=1224 RepID=A1WY85_HALHL|nr:TonB-dependent receptor [Halorhodospira halophila SL1]